MPTASDDVALNKAAIIERSIKRVLEELGAEDTAGVKRQWLYDSALQ